jgi:ribosomal protein S18 acetylase RimI-like enzyme
MSKGEQSSGPKAPPGLREIEAASVRSWPAPQTAAIDGWLWRYASGGSLRANSVATLAFHGSDVDAAIREAERRYRERGAPCRFTICGVSEPGDLDARLAALGYARGADHLTMAKAVGSGIAGPRVAAPAEVELAADAKPEWLAIYLAGLAPSRRAAAPALLAGLPPQRAYFSCRRGGVVVGSGLSVADGPLASIQCMATHAAVRRRGCARSILAAIEAWAAAQSCTHLYLQAEAANAGAIALYEGVGFHVAGRYHVRTKD